MKATLEFDLNDQDERMAHMAAIKSSDMAQLLWHIRFNLRSNIYHEVDNMNDGKDYEPGVELALAHLNELIDHYNINVDELTR